MKVAIPSAIVAFLCFPVCLAADPTKDPGGWGELRFGMTPQEVVDSMGPGVFLEEPERVEEGKSFKDPHTGSLDLAAATAFVTDTLSSDAKHADVSPDLLEACREVRNLLKARSWSYSAGSMMAVGNPRPQRVTATLVAVNDAFGSRMICLRTAAKNTPLINVHENQIDEKSKEHLKKVDQALASLAALRKDSKDEEEANPRKSLDPSTIEARDVVVRGITLTPRFTFDGGRLVSIALGTHFAGDGGFGFDHNGIHRTLCEALAEKYGAADEAIDKGNCEEKVWRFPETVLRCVKCRTDFPGSTFVRKGVSIQYEVPTKENARGDDNL